jgi:hypothetical protein
MALKRSSHPPLRIWVMLLAVAEAAGMTTAAAAARVGQAVLPDPQGAGQVAGAVGVATAGGIVEGVAIGLATGYLSPSSSGTSLPETVLDPGVGLGVSHRHLANRISPANSHSVSQDLGPCPGPRSANDDGRNGRRVFGAHPEDTMTHSKNLS